jgi:hypothetical protein
MIAIDAAGSKVEEAEQGTVLVGVGVGVETPGEHWQEKSTYSLAFV